jgi:propionyl-CoA carboxylase alpha chain
MAAQAASREAALVLGAVKSGFRNNPGPPLLRRFTVGAGDTERGLDVGYRLGRSPLFTVDGEELAVTLIEAHPEAVELVVDGVRRRFDVRRYHNATHVDSALGSATFRPVDRFPSKEHQRPSGSLVAPMPGTVVKVLAAPGDTVAKGDPVVVIEAMKMEHTIGAAGDGTVAEILVAVGKQVDIDEVIAVIKADDTASSGDTPEPPGEGGEESAGG